MKKSTNKYSKEDFLKILSNVSIEDLNDIIKNKGKKPKLIIPYIVLNK